jgi:hypothetical protein
VEGIGFECDGEGEVIDRLLAQLHFEKEQQKPDEKQKKPDEK